MNPRPSRPRPSHPRAAAIALAFLALHRTTQRVFPRFGTLAAVALALMLPLSPVVVAHAATPGSTHPGPKARGDVNRAGHADPTVGAHQGNPFAMHNQLLGSEPAEGARLASGPARVILTFDLPAQRGFSTIIVTGPDGNQWQAGPATEEGTTVSAPVRPLGPAGDYTVAWRIISADGHPVRATLKFTLTTPGSGTPAKPASNAGRDSGPTITDTGSAGTSRWPWAAGVGALLVAGVVVALRTRRTKR